MAKNDPRNLFLIILAIVIASTVIYYLVAPPTIAQTAIKTVMSVATGSGSSGGV